MKFLDLNKQYEQIKDEINNAVSEVLNSGCYIGGTQVIEFEKEIAKYCGTDFALSVNSGTDAIFLSLLAMGIGKGDEVITSPFTFIATAETIANTGATPVFVDIEPDTFNIDVKKIEAKITDKTKAILPVHIFGQIANMDEIKTLADKYNLKIIEDSAQAFGAKFNQQPAGSIGDAGCFSFFPSKILGAYGDGGMIVTNNKELADKIRLLKNHGSSPQDKYKNLQLGFNSRLDAMQASVLRVKLKYVDEWLQSRREVAKYYSDNLDQINGVDVPFVRSQNQHVWHQYTVKVDATKRDQLQLALKESDIPSMIYYSLPLHLQPAFEYLGYKKGDFPNTEAVSKQVLSLPIYPELSNSEQDSVIDITKQTLK